MFIHFLAIKKQKLNYLHFYFYLKKKYKFNYLNLDVCFLRYIYIFLSMKTQNIVNPKIVFI